MSTRTTTRDSGLLTWLVVLLLGVVGVGLVLPVGTTEPPAPVRLIGARTGDTMVIPALKVKAPLVSVAMSPQAVLTPPRNPTEVGWWKGSARPGSRTGQTLVTGHTVHTGGGALDRLAALRAGDAVTIFRVHDGTSRSTHYRVSAVRTYSKAALARHAKELFGQRGGQGRLVMVTCTGWDGHEYHGNVVVFASRVRNVTRPV